MKKCYVLRDMEFNRDDPKWIKQRIRNRYEKQARKYFGLYIQIEDLYPYEEKDGCDAPKIYKNWLDKFDINR
jgi:hypothetical protein